MPLPEEVINRLSEDRAPAGGWSSGLLWFAAALFLIVILLYAGITFAYEPYVNGKVSATTDQLNSASQSLTTAQSATLINEYSQVSHLRAMLQNHVLFSQLLTWLSKNTAPNVYYNPFSFGNGAQVTLTVFGKSENDLMQQLAIFEASPDVKSVTISGISLASVSGYWQTTMTLTVNQSLLTAMSTNATTTSQ